MDRRDSTSPYLKVKVDSSKNLLSTEVKKPSTPYGPYVTKAEIKLPWVKCLWCDYKDKIDFDLSLHFLDKHRIQLYRIPITKRERIWRNISEELFTIAKVPIEYRLDKAVRMAKARMW